MQHKFGMVWVSLLVGLPLVGCTPEAIEQAFSADPEAERWGESSDPPGSVPTTVSPSPSVGGVGSQESQSSTGLNQRQGGAPASVSPTPQTEELGQPPVTAASFQDLEQVPEQFQRYIADLVKLDVLTAAATPQDDAGVVTPLLAPNQVIDQGTFARWLVVINNRIYRDRPARQIRLAATTNSPAFTDMPASDPLFPYVQGLAEAGYIPSPLTGDLENTTFDATRPLTRETLLAWKVPVDRRQILPTATAGKIQEVWGFKDASQVSSAAAAAVLADHNNGELANIRRLVGATLLLQPQRSVTRAEAAASLWFIGIEGEGFSAREVLRSQQQAASASQPATP